MTRAHAARKDREMRKLTIERWVVLVSGEDKERSKGGHEGCIYV